MLAYFGRKLPNVPRAEVHVRVEEAVKFLFISPECRGQIPVTKEIDDVWHYWILETQEYTRLCSRLPAGGYIHHSSNDYLAHFGEAAAAEDAVEEAVRMLALYVEHFGPFAPDRVRYWRYASHLTDRFGWSVGDLNAWLVPEADAALTAGYSPA